MPMAMKTKAYYNENNRFCADWLRRLISAGLIAPGDVDSRSIADVQSTDLKGYTQCHFFAGIGGWSRALRLAGVPDDVPIWTGSCPCQPFSQAGKMKGFEDERHLWPEWFRLIKESKPAIVFGEQVSGAITRGWLDKVSLDLEKEDYAIGAAILPAYSVNSPHRRDRLWFGAGREIPIQARYDIIDSSNVSRRETFINGRSRQRNGEMATDSFAKIHGFIQLLAKTLETRTRTKNWWTTQPRMGRVVNGLPGAVDEELRAFGNAIVPQVAAEFITAFLTSNPFDPEQQELEYLLSQLTSSRVSNIIDLKDQSC